MNLPRLARVRRRMQEEGLDQLLVVSEQNLQYLTETNIPVHDRLNCLVIGPEQAVCVCYNLSVIPTEKDPVIYNDPDRIPEVLCSLLKDGGKTGVDGMMQSRFLLPLMDRAKGVNFTASKCVEETRCIKDADEIARLSHASAVTDRVFEKAFARLREGMTELEFGAEVSRVFEEEGVGLFHGVPMVAFGTGTADPHHSPGETRLCVGDAVMMDTGKQIDGYYSDMTRTVFFRKVSEEQKKVYGIVLEANERALEKAQAGNTLRDVHEAACKVIREAGYGEYYPHRTSHGIGIDYHEEPFDTPSRTQKLEVGMCFSVEPGIYLPGRFGVRVEDLAAITDTGTVCMTHAPKTLQVIR